MRVAWLALPIWLATLGCQPVLTDGRYSCTTSVECPSGWRCAMGRCRSGGDRVGCRIDAECADPDPCTLDICEAESCMHEPASGEPCDDGSFCNGEDQCMAGVCRNLGGPPPCPDCVGDVCGECGLIGQTCCGGVGGFCSAGACDEGGTCVDCGGFGERCCGFGEGCHDFATVCGASGTCETCGGNGQPCCLGGGCDLGFACLDRPPGPTCEIDPACAAISCSEWSYCVGGGCEPCGGDAQICCPGRTCMTGECSPSFTCDTFVMPS